MERSPTTDVAAPRSPTPPPEFLWKGAPALRRVHALNARCLEVLANLAGTEHGRSNVEIIRRHQMLWRRLTPTARLHAARSPFLLVDAQFHNEEWWRWAPGSARQHRERPHPYPRAVRGACFPARVAAELMRETLMLAWSTAAIDGNVASVLIGTTPAVNSLISELGPQDVERLAARHARYLRPRWEDVPGFWRALLEAAQAGDEDAVHEAHLYGLQLLGAELIPRRS